jgi:hypothetical protein
MVPIPAMAPGAPLARVMGRGLAEAPAAAGRHPGPMAVTAEPRERIQARRLLFEIILWSDVVSWDRPFGQPVALPGGRPARTLRDAGDYIRKLPQTERDTPEWRLAIQMLIDAAEDRGPMLFAKMGMERALNRNIERGFNSDRKDHHWGRRKLARDR